MKKFIDKNLKPYNTLRMDAVAETFYVPETNEELAEFVLELNNNNSNFHILSNGSNVLINNEKKIKTPIIYMGEVNNTLEFDENTKIFRAGCSVQIQKFINFIIDQGFGGIEYLYSLPAMVGGCICMNAGGGRGSNLQISDFIIDVTIFDGEKIRKITKEECEFSYRHSAIADRKWFVLEASFKFPDQSPEIGRDLTQKRMEFTKKFQDNSFPNVGSVFKKEYWRCWYLLRGRRIGGAMYSKKTFNWFLNVDNAKFSDFMRLIFWTKMVNKFLFFTDAKLEIIIIEE